MKLPLSLKALAVIAAGLRCVLALPQPSDPQVASTTYQELANIQLVEIHPDGTTTNVTTKEKSLEKRSDGMRAYLFVSDCKASVDYTWTDLKRDGCYSFVDSSGTNRDMYSLLPTTRCTVKLWKGNFACGGNYDQVTPGATNVDCVRFPFFSVPIKSFSPNCG
ncbi:hypothetical protein GQ53DRAFT_753020 [Thozetella sp. PMI_491]|nr:hypothetical protein GQ53DRAFT_753020 [Thozetella sp. PMI_491]